MTLISDGLTAAICEQISHELYNSNLYLFIAGFLKNKGLDNLASHFMNQVSEEQEHSRMFFSILTDLNSPVTIGEVDEISLPINDIRDIAKAYLNREIETTQSIEALKQMAIDEENSVAEEFFREMIKLQRKEYEEATSFSDRADLTSGDWKFVLLWDQSLGE